MRLAPASHHRTSQTHKMRSSWRRPWPPTLDTLDPMDMFTGEQRAREAVWRQGGERLWVREVTEWTEVTDA